MLRIKIGTTIEENTVEPIARVSIPIFGVAFVALMIYALTLQARIWHFM